SIEGSANIEILPGGCLTVSGYLRNYNGRAGIVVNSDEVGTGSLITDQSVLSTVQRHISAWTSDVHGWHFLSSPVSSQAIQPEFVPDPPTANQDFFSWDEATATWINTKINDGGSLVWNPEFETVFVLGKGYLTAYDSDQIKSFEQVLNVQDVRLTNLSCSGSDYSGWHLLGNPFPSAIAWNDGNWNMSNIAGTAKIWNESNASYTDIPANGIIPAMNGFMVQVTEGSGSLTIPAASRTHDDQSWYKNSGYPKIKLLVKDLDQNTAQESTILFHPEATEDYNPKLESRFLAGYAPQFYSVSGEEKFSTIALPINGLQSEIQMGFEKNNMGFHIIETVETSDNLNVFLLDRKLELEYDLTGGGSYLFEAADGDDIFRFSLKFESTGVDYLSNQSVVTWMFNNELYVTGTDKSVLVQVFNLTGQLLQSHQIRGAGMHIISVNQPTGMYLVRLGSSDIYQVLKFYIYRNNN
ncbi:MAG: T9SS type A sorting domain-containing protein, partial [Bacteroidales bacterium]|nr:T9SS type A sorting domain-containing protein [Bacteroidales bacterium]